MPDNINQDAQSKESTRKLGDSTTHSINEPGPGAPKPFKVPEDHTLTTPETLAQDYPQGYVGPDVEPGTARALILEHGDDPDDLEDEIDQAKDDGDFKSMHRSHKPLHSKKRK
jgi:hypothetical protein